MRWTDFCHLTSSYQYPRIVGSLASSARAPVQSRSRLFHDSAIRFGGLHVPVVRVDRRDGRCLPVVMRARLASDTPVAYPRDS
jgi:hypothetical protein